MLCSHECCCLCGTVYNAKCPQYFKEREGKRFRGFRRLSEEDLIRIVDIPALFSKATLDGIICIHCRNDHDLMNNKKRKLEDHDILNEQKKRAVKEKIALDKKELWEAECNIHSTHP